MLMEACICLNQWVSKATDCFPIIISRAISELPQPQTAIEDIHVYYVSAALPGSYNYGLDEPIAHVQSESDIVTTPFVTALKPCSSYSALYSGLQS